MFQDSTNTVSSGGTGITGWRTNPDNAGPIVVPTADLTLISPPSSGNINEASDPAVVSTDGDTLGDVIVTPTLVSAPPGGSVIFSPTSFIINSTSIPFNDFTITANVEGAYSIGISNNRGLDNPDPFTYAAQDPYVPPELDNNWIVDLHPLRPFGSSQGTVPAGSEDHAGESNTFNAQTEVAGTNVASVGLSNAGSSPAGTLDSDSLTRNSYEWIRRIEDPSNTARNCYVFRLDKTATDWEAHKGEAIRSQIPMTGNPRRTRPWGARTWFVTAVKIPSALRSVTNPGFICLMDLHTSQNDLGSGGDMVGLYFNPGGAIPENSSLRVTISTWSDSDWPNTSGGKEGPKHNITLFAGGSTPANQVPVDEWIYFAMDTRLWHGFDDPSDDPVATPTGPFYVKPYIAVGDSGPVVAKTPYTGTWGYPYGVNSAGWDRPYYCKVELYSNPKNGSNWTQMEIYNLGMREWLYSDIEAENPGIEDISAQDIIRNFRESREVTPP